MISELQKAQRRYLRSIMEIIPVQMKQRSFYSEIKPKVFLNLSLLFHLFLLFQLFHSPRWNRLNRWNTLSVLTIPKKMLHSICYSSMPPLSVPKNYQKECILNLVQTILMFLLRWFITYEQKIKQKLLAKKCQKRWG